MKTLFTTLVLALSVACFGQTSSIFGKVMAKEYNAKTKKTVSTPLPGAFVMITKGITQTYTTTDEHGRFKLPNLAVGKYDIQVQMISYDTTKITGIMVTSGVDEHLATITLHEQGIMVGKGFEVIAHKKPLIRKDGGWIEEMESKEVALDPNNKDIGTMIATITPTLKMTPDGRGISIKGARPINTQTFIDGIKTRGTNMTLPSMGVGNVKVYTAGIPAKYGDVTGGVIAIETKSYFDLIK